MQLLSLVPLVLAASSFATPAGPGNGFPGLVGKLNSNCNEQLSVGNLAGLPAPQKPVSFVLLGVGTQNYTCSDNGNYASAGAVAKLIDVSCFSKIPDFSKLPNLAFDIWNKVPASVSAETALKVLGQIDSRLVFGDHYFTANPAGGIRPEWDATSGAFKGNPQAFMYGAKAASVAAPTGSSDVDWLYLTNAGGSLADEVYRTYTKGGQPAASCTTGQTATVKYTAMYHLTGGSLRK
ncbi:hypothetical protein L218DRAFT_1078481 [Marasmius fiardii PR-910]|nr:hypothetical protein L218DRAFT_1078481 [Marasmius fiardii PR-910]